MPNKFEEAISKGAGKVGALAAEMKGLRGVFSTLAEEHKEVSALLKRAVSAKDPAKKEDLWRKIRLELLSHERAERQEVYPHLANGGALQGVVQEHRVEAEQLEAIIAELDALDPRSDAWDTSLRKLESVVKQHVDQEENEYFPQAQDAIGKDGAARLDPAFRAAKQSFMARLS